MQECSLITTSYRIGNRTAGSLGVVGPTRMNYSRVISLVDFTAQLVSGVISKR